MDNYPQAQLAWTHISSQENEDSLSSVYSRIGLRVAKGFALSNGWNLQPYAEVNAITSKTVAAKFITQTAHLMLQAAADVLKVRSA